MDNPKIEKTIERIVTLQERLCHCENNLQYIKRLQALEYWLHKFESLFNEQHTKYVAVYESYFHSCCGFSFYERVCNSVQEYKY